MSNVPEMETPRRRADDSLNGGPTNPPAEAERLYFRRRTSNPADWPTAHAPFQNEAAQLPMGGVVVPDPDKLLDSYRRPLQLAESLLPMRVARLYDLIERIRTARDNFRQVRREEEERLQNANEEARRADIRIEEYCDEIRGKYHDKLMLLEQEMEAAQEEWRATRESIAELRARLGPDGIPEELQNDSEDDDTLTDEDAPDGQDNADAASASQAVAASKSGRSLLSRLSQLVRPSQQPQTPAPQSEVTEIEDLDTEAQRNLPRKPQNDGRSQSLVPHNQLAGNTAADMQITHRNRPRTSVQYILWEFPRQEAADHAPPLEAIAAETGLLFTKADIHHFAGGQFKWLSSLLKVLSTLAFGAIFGFSVGVLTGLVDPELMQINWRLAFVPVLLCVVAGWIVFMAIGLFVSGVVKTICEHFYGHFLARLGEKDPDVCIRFHKHMKWAWLPIGLAALVLLVGIEALVERYGIVQVFIEAQQNLHRVGLGTKTADAGPGSLEFTVLALIASVPFVLLYAITAWREAKAESLHAYLSQLQALDIHRRATDLHNRRHAAHVQLRGGEVFEDHDEDEFEVRDGTASSELPKPSSVDNLALPTLEGQTQLAHEVRADSPEAYSPDIAQSQSAVPSPATEDIQTPESTAAHSTIDGDKLELRVDLARMVSRRKNRRVQMNDIRERRKNLEKERDERISYYRELRRGESSELPEASRQRIDNAYRQCEAVAARFDEEAKKLEYDLQRLRRGGILARLHRALLAPVVGNDNKTLEERAKAKA